jgi:DNA-binding transcriptional ArsR family regulator
MKKKSKQKLVILENQSEENSNPQYFDSEVRPNDYRVLDVLGETKSEYSFSGIMRKLGMHQETLSRSLHRLHELGIVDKSELGYKISNKMQGLPKNTTKQAYLPILLSYLPPRIGAEKIISEIAGKWFKNMRWIGMSEDNGQKNLQWIKQNGLFYINLKVLPNYIVIETNANNDHDKADAISGAYRIVQKITNLTEVPLTTNLTN